MAVFVVVVVVVGVAFVTIVVAVWLWLMLWLLLSLFLWLFFLFVLGVVVVVLVASALFVVCSEMVVHSGEVYQTLQIQSLDRASQLGYVERSFKGFFAEWNVKPTKATWFLLQIQIDYRTAASAVSFLYTIMQWDVLDVDTSPETAARELYRRFHVSTNDVDRLTDADGRRIRYA